MWVSNKISQLRNNFWVLWFLILTSILLIQLPTLVISPTIWMDEVQIIDYGRTIFSPQTDWSINWFIPLNKPVLSFLYLGNLWQSLAYDFTQSPLGPRLMSLFGALVAASGCLGWLLSLKTPRFIAVCLSLVYLLDPIFVSSYRGARVDCWAMGLCFITCWMIRHEINHLQSVERSKRSKNYRLFFIVGINLIAIISIWITGLLLLPLIFIEIYELLLNYWRINKSTTIHHLLIMVLGSCLTLLMIIAPIYPQFLIAFNDLLRFVRSDSLALNFSDKLYGDFNHLKTSLILSPFLLTGGIVSIFFIRKRNITYTFIFLLGLVFASKPYGNRIVYLIPYIILSLSCFFKRQYTQENNLLMDTQQTSIEPHQTSKRYKYRLSQICLIILLTWSILISLGYRNIVALTQIESRNPNNLYSLVVDVVKEDTRVLTPYEFYYAGRALNWKMFFPFGTYTAEEYNSFLSTMDYAIVPENQSDLAVEKLEDAGLSLIRTLNPPGKTGQNRFVFGGKPFGTYRLYQKPEQ